MKDRIAELTKALEAAVGRLQSIDGNINNLQNQRPPLIEEIIGLRRAIDEMKKLLPKEKK